MRSSARSRPPPPRCASRYCVAISTPPPRRWRWLGQPYWVEAVLYVGLGWIAVAVIPRIAAAFGSEALLLLLAGGLLYTAGAVFYGLRRPRLWQRVFGYHELFHVFVIAASVIFYVFMLRFVVPFPKV